MHIHSKNAPIEELYVLMDKKAKEQAKISVLWPSTKDILWLLKTNENQFLNLNQLLWLDNFKVVTTERTRLYYRG